jgi:hypothetical protein
VLALRQLWVRASSHQSSCLPDSGPVLSTCVVSIISRCCTLVLNLVDKVNKTDEISNSHRA